MRRLIPLLPLLAALALAPAARAAGTLRIGLNEDPGTLDPAQSGGFVDRIMFASLCDKLIDLSPKLDFVPQLATAWDWSEGGRVLTLHLRPGVLFQDGTKMDAAAVAANIARYQTAPESLRKTELKSVVSVEVVDPTTIRLHLRAPDATLIAALADRAGMMISPAAIKKYGRDLAIHPVCAGPFRLAQRVAQDHITLSRFRRYWNARAIHFDQIIFRPIPDTTVRLVNLQSGQLDLIERMAPTDAAAVRRNSKLRLVSEPSLAYALVLFNLTRGTGDTTPLAKLRAVREAFAKSLDRAAINKVAFNGEYIPANQTETPGSRYWNPAHPVAPRDVDGARALLKQAGLKRVPVTLTVAADPIDGQEGELIQSMAGEAGFDVRLQSNEVNAQVADAKAGSFQATLVFWSGRPDPDANIAIWAQCDGFLNWGGYCNKQDGRAAGAGPGDARSRGAGADLPAGRRHLPARPALRRALSPALAMGDDAGAARVRARRRTG